MSDWDGQRDREQKKRNITTKQRQLGWPRSAALRGMSPGSTPCVSHKGSGLKHQLWLQHSLKQRWWKICSWNPEVKASRRLPSACYCPERVKVPGKQNLPKKALNLGPTTFMSLKTVFVFPGILHFDIHQTVHTDTSTQVTISLWILLHLCFMYKNSNINNGSKFVYRIHNKLYFNIKGKTQLKRIKEIWTWNL